MELNKNDGNFICPHVQVISVCLFSYPARTKLGIHRPNCEINFTVCTLAIQMMEVDVRVFT